MRTAAVLPIKSFSGAKQRLGQSVGEALRRDLARAMVGDVLVALASTPELELTIVITREPTAAAAAAYKGALVIDDTSEEGQSAAVALGVARAVDAGVDRVLCIPGDCPAVNPAELGALLSGSAEEEVVIIPDRHGTGTNGLLLSPPAAIPPSFGPGSCERHLALAAHAGLPCRIERPPSLLLDIDTGEDLAALRARLSAESLHATRTRKILGIAQPHGIAHLPTSRARPPQPAGGETCQASSSAA